MTTDTHMYKLKKKGVGQKAFNPQVDHETRAFPPAYDTGTAAGQRGEQRT